MRTETAEPAQTDDFALLSAFAREGSEPGFRLLVERHSSWVYATAYRQLRDAHLAEDATQAVFILLCQRAKKMNSRQKLSGWLFVTVGYVVKSILRAQRRRRHYEKLAVIDRPSSVDPPPLADNLDAAVGALRQGDRTAILLRFYQGLDFAAVARTLGISDEAAKKRVARAVARLRARLGVTLSPDDLTAASTFGLPSASAAISAHASSVALTAADGGAVPASIAPALKGTIFIMAMTKAKIAATAALIFLLMGTGIGIVCWQLFIAPAEPDAAGLSPKIAPIVAASPIAEQTFQQIYALQPADVIRRVSPPFAPARMEFYQKANPQQAQMIPRGPNGMVIYWRNGNPQLWGMTFGRSYRLQDLLEYFINVYPQDLEGDQRLMSMNISGDFVVNGDSTKEQLRVALEAIVGQASGGPVTLTTGEVERPVIVFKGKWHTTIPPGEPNVPSIALYGENLNPHRGGGGGAGSIDQFAKAAGDWIKKPVFFEASELPQQVGWSFHDIFDNTEAHQRAHDLALVCKHIQEQTGLTWTQETRVVKQWFLEPAK